MKDNLNLFILTQDETNRSCKLLKEALENKGHKITLLQYPNERASKKELSWNIDSETGLATRRDEKLNLKDSDGMMVRSWGTAPIAATYAKVFEDFGAIIANDIDKTTKSNSKVATTRLFKENNVPMPYSKAYFFDDIKDEDLSDLIKNFADGKKNFVVKSDYGTRGEEIRFYSDPEEAKQHVILEKVKEQKGFVLQDFINTGEKARSYRVNVVGGKVKVGVEITAPDGESIANIANFSDNDATRLLNDDELTELSEIALSAAKVLGMECCCGVDLVKDLKTGEIFVLEANDGPVISTIVDQLNIPLHEWAADALIEKVINEKLIKGEKLVDHQKFLHPLNSATAASAKQSRQDTQHDKFVKKTTSEKKHLM